MKELGIDGLRVDMLRQFPDGAFLVKWDTHRKMQRPGWLKGARVRLFDDSQSLQQFLDNRYGRDEDNEPPPPPEPPQRVRKWVNGFKSENNIDAILIDAQTIEIPLMNRNEQVGLMLLRQIDGRPMVYMAYLEPGHRGRRIIEDAAKQLSVDHPGWGVYAHNIDRRTLLLARRLADYTDNLDGI